MSTNQELKEQLMAMTVSVTRHYAGQSVTIELGGSFVVSSPVETSAVYDKLHYRVNEEHKRVEVQYAHKVFMPLGDNRPTSAHEGERVVEITVNSVDLTFQGEKKMAKVCGGRWQKFGVPMYPENFIDAPASIREGGSGEVEVGRYTARVLLVNDKPKRVLSIVDNHSTSE